MLTHNKYSCCKYPNACIYCSLNTYCKQIRTEIGRYLPGFALVLFPWRQLVPGRRTCIREDCNLGESGALSSCRSFLFFSLFPSFCLFLPLFFKDSVSLRTLCCPHWPQLGSNPPASASQSAGLTGVCYSTKSVFL